MRVTSNRRDVTPAAGVRRERLAFERDSVRAQASWLRLSTDARQVFDYNEYRDYIQLDHPPIILKVIRDVFHTVAFRAHGVPK